MGKKRKFYPKPAWLNQVPPRWIRGDTKRLYVYFCSQGPNTSWEWNIRLARRFFISRRTVCFWLQKLRTMALIWIEKPGSKYRRIHPIYYASFENWIKAAQRQKISETIGGIGNIPHFVQRKSLRSRDSTTSLRSVVFSKERAGSRHGKSYRGNSIPPCPPGGSKRTYRKGKKWMGVRQKQLLDQLDKAEVRNGKTRKKKPNGNTNRGL